jgi:hypothetical protein
MRLFRILISAFLFLLFASPATSHMIPFGFWKQGPVLNWDFTATTTLPSQLTFTRASTATYFNSAGTMQTATTNTPRFDYDMTTHVANGLLMEAAATNMIAGSSNLVGTYWDDGGSGPTVSLDAAVAPDGTTTADRVSTSGDVYFFPNTPTTTINTNYTFSFYAKSTVPGYITVVMQEAGGSFQWYAQTSPLLTTSWQRFSITAQRTTANPMRAVIALYHTTYGDTTVADFWGAQYELGSVATSYIPTTTTANVTRAADSATFNTMTWFNATNGTLFSEYTNLGAESASTYRVFGLFNTNVAGTFSQNAIEIADSGTTGAMKVTTASSAVFSPAGALNAANTVNREAMTYQANAFTSSVNRGAVTTDSSGTLPAPAYGYIGSAPDGNIRNRYIRKIKYFANPVTNPELVGF